MSEQNVMAIHPVVPDSDGLIGTTKRKSHASYSCNKHINLILLNLYKDRVQGVKGHKKSDAACLNWR